MTLGDRIAVFHQGRIEQLGTPLSLYEDPATEFVAGFIGAPAINLVDRPAASASAAHQALWSHWASALPAPAQRLGVRPEHLQLAPAGEGVPAQLDFAEHLGDTHLLYARVDGLDKALTLKINGAVPALQPGDRIGLTASQARVLGFDGMGQRARA